MASSAPRKLEQAAQEAFKTMSGKALADAIAVGASFAAHAAQASPQPLARLRRVPAYGESIALFVANAHHESRLPAAAEQLARRRFCFAPTRYLGI